MEYVYELIGWGCGYLVLNLEKFEEFEDNKLVVEARIDEALFNIYEGTDQYKLIQIANYISDRMVYNPGVRETIDGLNGQGVCATYSMLFYKMATRLGIQTYICYGYTSSFYHSWNMVELNGKQYFYDITWFDGYIYNYAYIQSEDCWERKYVLNDLWEGAY